MTEDLIVVIFFYTFSCRLIPSISAPCSFFLRAPVLLENYQTWDAVTTPRSCQRWPLSSSSSPLLAARSPSLPPTGQTWNLTALWTTPAWFWRVPMTSPTASVWTTFSLSTKAPVGHDTLYEILYPGCSLHPLLLYVVSREFYWYYKIILVSLQLHVK